MAFTVFHLRPSPSLSAMASRWRTAAEAVAILVASRRVPICALVRIASSRWCSAICRRSYSSAHARAARDVEETPQVEEIASDLNGIRAEDEAASQPEAEPAVVVEEPEPAAVEPADADVAPVMEEEPDGHHLVRGLGSGLIKYKR